MNARAVIRVTACVAAVATAACGSTTSTTQDDAAAPLDGGLADAPGDAGADAEGDATGDAASSSAFCAAEAAFAARCRTAACTADLAVQCPSVEGHFSAWFVQAYIACSPTDACTADHDPQKPGCYHDQLTKATLSSAQNKVAQDYCMACGTPGTPCEQGFFVSSTTVDPPGVVVLDASDSIVQEVDATCATAAAVPTDGGSCRDAFIACSITVLQKQYGGNPPSCPK
jgi:hypothetical protein